MKGRCWLAALALAGAPALAAPPPVAQSQSGPLVGTADADGVLRFRAVPYAAPPLAALRWQPPQPPARWTSPRDATHEGASCLQNDYGWNHADYVRGSEDCLTLDIATPSLAGKRPVMVWIHGGSNRAGSAGGTVLSDPPHQGAVLVAIQYRLGIFGFLPHRALAAEQGGKAGNYGLMDQIAALRWIKANVARFGGDPDRIMIFGESAGAEDVGYLLASPQTRGLFAAAALQSGTPGFGLPPRPLDEALRLGDQLDAVLGTDGSAAPLRAASPHALLEADKALHDGVLESDDFMWLRTTIDGAVLPAAPEALLAKASPRPVIVGSNRAEFGLPGGRPHRDGNVALAFGPNEAQARAFYRLDEGDPPEDPRLGSRDLRIATDILFRCPSGRMADLLAAHGWPVWRYELDLAPGGARSFHGSDIGYVLGKAPLPDGSSLQAHWLSLAATGAPLSTWPGYAPARTHLAISPQGVTTGQALTDIPCRWSRYL
ncbi:MULTISPECIES: carboxylesterase family protein [unclassified Novosphingobium]|uniref:carboxylesterase family protein n=1 Tax=unclassified Novosphingobium TaxID=2644732 RepID=UPI00146B8152|nr:para-nitrobenzyl esterase [Novosphingobium sp. SG919]NMN85528.1 para-nitrobenzyl esterase [Novosphingobium sp. SG916]